MVTVILVVVIVFPGLFEVVVVVDPVTVPTVHSSPSATTLYYKRLKGVVVVVVVGVVGVYHK